MALLLLTSLLSFPHGLSSAHLAVLFLKESLDITVTNRAFTDNLTAMDSLFWALAIAMNPVSDLPKLVG